MPIDLHDMSSVRDRIHKYLNAGFFSKKGQKLLPKGEKFRGVADLRELSFGLNNVVYDMRVECKVHRDLEERNFILRIYPNNENFLKAEKEASRLRSLQNLHVPIPKLFFFENDLNVLGYRFLILEKVVGEPVTSVVNNFNASQIKYFLGDLAYRLGHLHTIRSKKYDSYYLDSKALKKMSYGDYVLQEVDYSLKGFAEFQLEKTLDVDVHYLAKWCQGHKPLLNFTGYSMVHGDLRPSNIIVQGNKITGFIDWEMSCFQDPASDLGWTLYFFKLYENLKKERGFFFNEYWKYCEKYDVEARVYFYEFLAALKMYVYMKSLERVNPQKYKENLDLFKRVNKIFPEYIGTVTHR